MDMIFPRPSDTALRRAAASIAADAGFDDFEQADAAVRALIPFGQWYTTGVPLPPDSVHHAVLHAACRDEMERRLEEGQNVGDVLLAAEDLACRLDDAMAAAAMALQASLAH